MDLRPYVDNIHHQIAIAAEAGGAEARALAQRLAAPLDAAIRLTLHEVLATAAEEITTELAPGSVEVRLRGREPEFVVTPPQLPPGAGSPDREPDLSELSPPSRTSVDGDEGVMMRINVRLPEQLKSRVENAADQEGLSINAWLVRAATAALDRTDRGMHRVRRAPRGAQRYTGWGR